jgi:hypothetical protein
MRAGPGQGNVRSNHAAPSARRLKADRQWWTIFALLVMTVGAVILFHEAANEPLPSAGIAQPPVSQAEIDQRLAQLRREHPTPSPTTTTSAPSDADAERAQP